MVKTQPNPEIDQRGRSTIPKTSEQERARSLSTQPLLDPINSRLSKSNENLTQTNLPKQSPTIELPRNERLTKSEDRHLSNTILNDVQIQRYNAMKEKFERQQPIDILFGIHPSINTQTSPFFPFRSSSISVQNYFTQSLSISQY